MAISIVVPVYNEGDILSRNGPFFKNLAHCAELIFVDGGSSDSTVERARDYGKVIRSKKGRALQMNIGAQQAQFDSVLFLHADNIVAAETIGAIENHLRRNGCVGGCLTQKIDKKGFIFRLLERYGNSRARISKVFYGDQGIFVKKDIFLKLNGFPQVPILEDTLFTKRLRQEGKTVVLDAPILVSARRWEKKGVLRTILLHCFISVLFLIKVPLHKISQLYDDVR